LGYIALIIISLILSSQFLCVFDDDHVTHYMGADGIVGDDVGV